MRTLRSEEGNSVDKMKGKVLLVQKDGRITIPKEDLEREGVKGGDFICVSWKKVKMEVEK